MANSNDDEKRDEVLRKMLNTPPKPKDKAGSKDDAAKKKKAPATKPEPKR